MNYDIVFHVDLDEQKNLNIAITNIDNYFTAIEGKKAEVVLLVNGPAVNLIKKDVAPQGLSLLQSKGLSIRVCQNAINHFSLTKEILIDNITVVPAGIVELVRLQNEHFSYVKP